MPSKPADKNGSPSQPSRDRVVAEMVTGDPTLGSHPASDAGHPSWTLEWERTLSDLDAISDDTDTDEVWSDVLRNLGVEAEAEGV
jgi:hypothetical protein